MIKVVRCEVYSRIVGYFRPVENWNIGKTQEFSERVTFDEKGFDILIPIKIVSC
jgi:hypothetical protein